MQENKYRSAELSLFERREKALNLINENCRGAELFNTMADADVLNYLPSPEGDCVQFARNIADSRIFARVCFDSGVWCVWDERGAAHYFEMDDDDVRDVCDAARELAGF